MSLRRRPLHTCGVSFLEIAHRACTRAKDLNGPLGSMRKKIDWSASLASPIIYALQWQFLEILTFADDRILALQSKVESVFPPCKYVFNQIDEILRIVETLPGKFDDVVNKFPAIIHQVPFLDWALVRAISWLNFWLSILTDWGSGREKEKEIVVDTSCSKNVVGGGGESAVVQETEHRNESQSNGVEVDFGPVFESSGAGAGTGGSTPGSESETAGSKVMKCTYKDALEKGKKENTQKQEDSPEEIQKASISMEEEAEEKTEKKVDCGKETQNYEVDDVESAEETAKKKDSVKVENYKICASEEAATEGGDKSGNKMDQSIGKDDLLLALFESSWLMTPVKKGGPGSISRSLSYT